MKAPRPWVDVAGLLVAAVASRFGDLGGRMFHQDESVSAWIVEQLVRGSGYHADPAFHGPLLYHLDALLFLLAGGGELQARTAPAAFGVIVAVLVYGLSRPHLGRATALLAGALCVLSPTLTYYSRFVGHDMLIAAFTLVMVFMPFEYRRTGRPRCLVWFAAALGLAIATKLNAYFIVGTLLLYGLSYAVFAWREGRPLDVRRGRASLRANAIWLAAAGLVFLSIFIVLFASTFAFHLRAGVSPAGALSTTAYDAFVAGFRHWIDMDRQGRLDGPFHFYVPILAIYEPIVVLASLGALVYFTRERLQFLVTLAALLVFEWVLISVLEFDAFAGEVLRMERGDVLFASSLVLGGGWSVLSLWRAHRHVIACWIFVGVVQFLLYSYAGEKVPWLTVHVLLPWLVVSAAALVEAWHVVATTAPRVLLAAGVVVLAAVTAHGSWVLNTRNRSHPAEPLVQIEYSQDVGRLVAAIADLASRLDEPPTVRLERPVQWPFAWYLRDLPLRFTNRLSGASTGPVLLAADGAPRPQLEARYERVRLGYQQFSLWIDHPGDVAGLLRFMLSHDRWGEEHTTYLVAWIRRDLVERFGDLAPLRAIRAAGTSGP